MATRNETIFNILKHRRCYKVRKGNVVTYSINSLKFTVPGVISKMIDDLVAKKAYVMLKQLIVVHKDHFNTNFGD
jgi:hypothetical protein